MELIAGNLTDKNKSPITATETKYLRKVTENTIVDRVRNETIMNRLKQKAVISIIEKAVF